jgi:dipeptidyl aminopeptidase/acylaminoacyl peptidase
LEHPFEKREPLSEPGAEESGPLLSPNGKHVAFTRLVRDAQELYVGLAAEGRPSRVDMPVGSLGAVALANDGKTLFAVRESYTEVPHLSRIDLATGKLAPLTPACLPNHQSGDFASPRAIKFRNREGMDVEGRVWTPANAGPELPLIVRAHGGPSAHFRNCWDTHAQWFVAQGYGLLDYDYRGSSGHGREFRRALYGRWGDAEMLDTYDAVAWALANLPWVRRERIGLWGASYGGYMAYHALAQQPALFRCAVASCGDTELYDSIYHGNRNGRLDTIRQMGDPDAHREVYRKASPLYRVEDFQAPLLISHGRADTQVPVIMTEMLVRELKNQGKYHEVKIYDGEGHGNGRPENALDQLKREFDFFNRHLKGNGA